MFVDNLGSWWIGVIITILPPRFDSSRIATDIYEEIGAEYPTETELSTLYLQKDIVIILIKLNVY